VKITYVTQACVLIEVHGKKILCDPWLVGPCWAGNLWHFPPPKREPESFTNIDYIYFSHGHEDHFQLESIRRLPLETKDSQVLISDYDKPYWENAVRAAGFKNIIMLEHDESLELDSEIKLHMLRNDEGDDDSSIVIESDNSTVFFQTDNIMSYKEAERLGKKFDIDLFFTIPTLTGVFPAFFDFEPKTMMKLAEKKQMSSIKYSTELMRLLKAKTAIPYACDLCYFGDLYYANELHMSDKEKYANYVKQTIPDSEVIIMNPDDEIEINDGKIITKLLTPEFTKENLASYAVMMRPKYEQAMLEEKKYLNEPYENDIGLLKKELDRLTETWMGENFKVLWKIVGPDGKISNIWHNLPNKTSENYNEEKYDLRLELQSYRLQRWARNDYPMGGQTIRNGSVRCHRYTDEYTKNEDNYWDLTSKINFRKIHN
tara:strand:- start:437 stop:1726 length:1290 start_codon:yes stop_codon:yes gene_type:complete